MASNVCIRDAMILAAGEHVECVMVPVQYSSMVFHRQRYAKHFLNGIAVFNLHVSSSLIQDWHAQVCALYAYGIRGRFGGCEACSLLG
eukprot:1144765-Pelagomonas_calceolata.AAC.2